jgi:hypothetical protein
MGQPGERHLFGGRYDREAGCYDLDYLVLEQIEVGIRSVEHNVRADAQNCLTQSCRHREAEGTIGAYNRAYVPANHVWSDVYTAN